MTKHNRNISLFTGEEAIVGLAFFMAAAAFWGAGSQILAAGVTEFTEISWATSAIVCVLLALLFWAILLAIYLLLRLFGLKGVGVSIVAWCASYAMLTGVSFPLPVSDGMVTIENYKFAYHNLAISIIGAMLFTGLIRSSFSRTAAWVAFAVALGTIVQAAVSSAMRNTAPASSLQLSGTGDIIVLSFDGIQRDIFIDAMKRAPDLTGRFKDFLFFDNLLASSPATLASLAGEFLGNLNYKAVIDTQDALKNLTAETGTHVALARAGYRIGGYGVYTMLMPGQTDLGKHFATSASKPELMSFVQNLTARIVGPRLVSSDGAEVFLGGLVGLSILSEPSKEGTVTRALKAHIGPDWDRSLLRTWDDLPLYLEGLTTGANTPAAHFMHFTFTHHPVDFDASCSFRSTQKEWHSAMQSREGLVDEAICAIRTMDSALARLEAVGAFEHNLVIIKSDHGAPVEWNRGRGIEAERIRNHPLWGYGRYVPILMIKPPGRRRDRMERDIRPAILDDLAPTICIWAKLGDACSNYHGMDLLNSNNSPPSTYWVNVVTSEASNYRIDTQQTILVERSSSSLEALKKALGEIQ